MWMVLVLMFHTLFLRPPIRPNSDPGSLQKSELYTGERESKSIGYAHYQHTMLRI